MKFIIIKIPELSKYFKRRKTMCQYKWFVDITKYKENAYKQNLGWSFLDDWGIESVWFELCS